MAITLTGDVAFKQKLIRVLQNNELNGRSAYALFLGAKGAKRKGPGSN